MVSVVPLSFDIDAYQMLHYLTDLDQSSIVNYSDSGIAHISGKRLKQRFAFGIPQIGDLYSYVDLAKDLTDKFEGPICHKEEIIISIIYPHARHFGAMSMGPCAQPYIGNGIETIVRNTFYWKACLHYNVCSNSLPCTLLYS